MTMHRREHAASDRAVDGLLRAIMKCSWETEARAGARLDAERDAGHHADLRQLGLSIHATGGIDALDEAIFRIAEMDPAFADQRSVVLEVGWGEIGRVAV